MFCYRNFEHSKISARHIDDRRHFSMFVHTLLPYENMVRGLVYTYWRWVFVACTSDMDKFEDPR